MILCQRRNERIEFLFRSPRRRHRQLQYALRKRHQKLFTKMTDLSKGGLRASPPDNLHGRNFLGVKYSQYINGCWRAMQRDYIDTLRMKFPPQPKVTKLRAKTQLPTLDLGPSQRSKTEAEADALSKKYGMNYPSVIGSVIYLWKTRPDLKPATISSRRTPNSRGRSTLKRYNNSSITSTKRRNST